MSKNLGPIAVDRKSGDEHFHGQGQPLEYNLLEFWQWSSSDIVSNATRGILAEYLVARTIGNANGARSEWDMFDAVTKNDVRVEVKSSAYIQSWDQKKYSQIKFSIRPTFEYDDDGSLIAEERKRQADVYVFCLLDHRDQETIDPLDVSQWRFFVISTEALNAQLGDQKTIGLSALREIAVEESEYGLLSEVIDRVAEEGYQQATFDISQFGAPNGYPQLLEPDSVEEVTLPSGESISILKAAPVFDVWEGEPVDDVYGGKPVLRHKDQPAFAEMAILQLLHEDGWEGVWVDSWEQKYRVDYWDDDEMVELPPGKEALLRAIYKSAGKQAGCFDLFCWKDDQVIFAESKWCGRDKIRETQQRWLEAALEVGLAPESFLIVEWQEAQ